MSQDPLQPHKQKPTASARLHRNPAWRVYFYFYTLLMASGLSAVIQEEEAGIAEFVALFLAIPSTIGFFIYCFPRRYLSPHFWRVLFPVVLIHDVLYRYYTNVDLLGDIPTSNYVMYLGIGYVAALPPYFALWSLGKDNNPIWKLPS